MDELQKLYDVLIRDGYYTKSFDDFKVQFKDPGYQDKVYGVVERDGLFTKGKDEFVKKYISSTVDDQSMIADPVKKKDEAYTTPLWQQPQGQPEPEPKQEQTLPFLESKPSGFSLGSQRVPEEEVAQRPVAPYRQSLIDESLPELKTAEEIQEIINRPEYKEQTYFTGVFGDVLKWMDTPSGVSGMNPFPRLGIGEMIDDFGRAVATGMNTGDIVNTTAPLYIAGKKSSDQEIEAFMSASDVADKLGPSDEMVAFSTQYKESDQDVLGFIDAISSNPGAIPDIMVSSFASMVNETSIKAGLAVSGSMAVTYAGIAAAGASPTGLGALAAGAGGAVTGAVASIPYAMGAMGAVLETNLSFGEAVKEKLAEDGLSWTKENIRKVLEQDDFLNTARVKAAARGITIGVIDAYTGRIAGKIGANLLKAPGKSALVKSALASSGIEAVGGSGGEAAARLVTGQEMDVAEIGLEGIGEMPMAVIDVGAAVLNQPVYKVNGEIRTENDVRDLISTATSEELGLIKIDIRNDKKGYNKQIQDKIVTGAIRAEVREVNPNMDDATVDAITALEEEKNKFSGKKTQSAKDKVASISSQIKTLQENAVQKPSTEESVLRAEESQVGLPEVGEGDTKVQAPTEEVIQEEVVDEDLQATFDRLLSLDETEDSQPIKTPKNKAERKAAARKGDMVYHNFFGDIVESTREQYNNALKEVSETGAIENIFNYGKYLSPRQAPNELEIEYEPSLLDMKKEDAESEIKWRTKDEASKSVVSPAPKVSSKIPKAKSVPIPVAIPKPAPAPAPKPVAVVSQPQEDVKIYSYNGKNYEIKRLSVKEVGTDKGLPLEFGRIIKAQGKLLTPATPVVAKAKTKAAPKAKVEPVKVAPTIVSKPAPASKPVIVPAPTTIVGPVQLREAHMANVNAIRTDQTLTQRQKDAKVDALKVEYQARKAEMESTTPAAAKPKTEAKAKTKAAPKKVEPVKVVSKKDEVAIQQLENDIEYAESEIENAKEEIGNTEYNLKEALAEIEKKRDALENKKMSDAAREEANEDLDLEETNAEENYDDEIKKYNDELKEASKDKKKAERRLAKLTGAPAIEAMEEDGPSLEDLEEVDDIVDEDEDGDEFESIKDLDPKVESVGKRVIDRINKLDAALVKHSKSSLNSGIPIPVARLILKAIKGFIKLGMTVNQAIVRVAADMNLAKKDIIESLKELDAIYLSQSALAKVRAQVNLEVTAALASKRSVNEKRKALSDAIKAMAVTGDIASTKVQTLLNRIGKINLDNPVAVENFLKYVENVFNDAAYDTELAGLRAKVAKAKTNVGTKLGTAEGITPLINRLLSIKPSLIPAQLLDSYREIIEMFGSSDAVLVLGNIDDVTTQIQELLDGIDEYLSVIPELTELISDYGNRVLNEDGSLNYQETLVKMLADKTITEEQYNIMRKYKSLIVSKETKPTKTKEEDAQEKKVLLEALSQTDVDMSAVIGNDEKKMAARLIKLAKSSAANILTNRQLLNLLKVFDNINNGYFPHYANKLYVELEAAHKVGFLTNALLKASNRVGLLTKALLKVKMPKLAEYSTKLRSIKREAIFDRIKNIPLFNIDEVFGDFKTKEFFNAIFDQLASAQQVYNIEVERIGKRLDAMSDRIAKSYGENHNGFVEAKMKLAIYRIQLEYQSNPGDPRVNPALAYINKTLEAIKEGNTMYSDRDAEVLKEIATEYSKGTGENATIDNEKLFASFTPTEKAALKLFDDINKSLEKSAVFTGDVIRGDQVHLLVNYNHLNVLPGKDQSSSSLAEASTKFNPSTVASTKAGSLIERTKGVKAINFDIFTTVQRGANHVLLDYHLTNPVRIARRAISLTRQQIEDSDDGSKATSNQLNMLGAISDAVELALKAMLDSSLVKDSLADMVAKDLARTGYRSMLAGIPRASVELASNMAYVAIAARKEYAKGLSISRKNGPVVWGEMAANIMKVAGAKTMSRVIGSDSLTGRIVDSSVLSKRTKRSSTILTPAENTILTVHNRYTKKLKNGVEYVADNLISSPDKIMMRPLWFGSFANAFKSITGVEPDFGKMNTANVDYLTEYQDAINSATNVADEKVAMAGNVDNPFMNSLRSFIPSDAGALTKTYKVFNNFMNKFMIGEYLVARRGIHAMMGDGSISRKQGAALLAAVVTRMTVYSVGLAVVSQFVYGLFTDDEDEDDQKSFDKKLGQGLASTATSLLLGRTYGNLVRTGINAGVELFNEEYLDGLREGDYDPYKDAIQYTFIQPGTTGKGVDLGDVFTAIAGPYAPAMKTASFALKTLGAADKKEDAAIERADDEKYYRLPLEIFGNLGYVPLYKDIRTIVNKNIYAALDKELKKQEKKKASGGDDKEKESDFKPMGLNRVDLKRYYPEIYEQYYGEGSEAEATRKIEYEKNRLEREIKDERYGYIPKKRSKKRETTRGKRRDTKRRGGR